MLFWRDNFALNVHAHIHPNNQYYIGVEKIKQPSHGEM